MELNFKRNYDKFFIFLLIIGIIAVVITFFPGLFDQVDPNSFPHIYIYIITWFNVALLCITYFGVTKRAHTVTVKQLTIKRSLFKNLVIDYDKISSSHLNENGKTFLIFGKLPVLTVTYNKNNRHKKIKLRAEKIRLLAKIIENENKIHTIIAKNSL